MTDRELLRLAAKAAGLALAEYQGRDDDPRGLWLDRKHIDPVTHSRDWNPLASDADALRLAVKLALAVSVCANMPTWDFTVILGTEIKELHDHDALAATRRAIVRAAAEIGKDMP